MQITQQTDYRRRAAAYIVVFGTSLLIAVIGVSAITASRLQLRSSTWNNDAREAGVLALSAVEYALAKLDAETVADSPDWRDTHTSGQQVADMPFGRGTISYMLVDADGNLSDNNNDNLALYGIGTVGEARRVYRVQLETTGLALDCLGAAIHSGSSFWINNASDTLTATGAPITANQKITNWGTFSGDLETAAMLSNHGTVSGTITEVAPLRQMPDPDAVFHYYVKRGTTIDVNGLDVCTGGRPCITRNVLTPTYNPYGATNREGIYVIDCKGQDVAVRDARIKGTLVLLDPGNAPEIGGGLVWEAAVPNYPALLVRTTSYVYATEWSDTLDEATLGTNFNPVEAVADGDADLTDTYNSKVSGIIYVSGTLYMGSFAGKGVVITDNQFNTIASVPADIQFTHSATTLRNPPPGFKYGARVVPVAGSWERGPLP